jgi:hypothetical protein
MKGYNMKIFIVALMVGFINTIGYSQSLEKNRDVSDATIPGLKIKPIQIEEDFYDQMQRNIEKNKMKTSVVHSGKTSIIKDIGKTGTRIKYRSTADPKPKQFLGNNQSRNIGQGNKQYFSQAKAKNKIRRVKEYAPREEIVKIQGHPKISQEILIQSLGNVRPIKASKPTMNTLK